MEEWITSPRPVLPEATNWSIDRKRLRVDAAQLQPPADVALERFVPHAAVLPADRTRRNARREHGRLREIEGMAEGVGLPQSTGRLVWRSHVL